MIICFTGIDGSGKTMQARLLVERLNAAGLPARYVWTGGRAYLTRPLIWAAKAMLRAPRLARTGRAIGPHPRRWRGFPLSLARERGPGGEGRRRNGTPDDKRPTSSAERYSAYLGSTNRLFRRPLVRKLWQQISLAEHSAEILANVLPQLARGRIVVCDRYLYDSLVGIAVLAGLAPAELPGLLPKRYAVPRPDHWFLIDLPPAVAFARRDDVVDVAFLERRAPLYRTLAAELGAHTLDGTATPEQIAAEVWRLVQPALAGRHPAPTSLNREGREGREVL